MFENNFGLIEAAFVFGLAVAFYIWQMRDLAKADGEGKDSTGIPSADNPPDTRHDRADSSAGESSSSDGGGD